MFKALRRVKETASLKGNDAEDKRKLSEIRDAAATLLKTLQFYYKTFADHNANTAAVHEDIANLYPANQRLSVAVAHLHTEGKVFTEASAVVEELKKELEPPLQTILAKIKELSTKADERAVARGEIEHYKEKVSKLANEGLNDAKKQDKAESNQKKLKENQEKFTELDAELETSIADLDNQVSSLTNAALATFLSVQVAYNKAVLGVYTSALDLANSTAAAGAAVLPAAEAAAVESAAAPVDEAPEVEPEVQKPRVQEQAPAPAPVPAPAPLVVEEEASAPAAVEEAPAAEEAAPESAAEPAAAAPAETAAAEPAEDAPAA